MNVLIFGLDNFIEFRVEIRLVIIKRRKKTYSIPFFIFASLLPLSRL